MWNSSFQFVIFSWLWYVGSHRIFGNIPRWWTGCSPGLSVCAVCLQHHIHQPEKLLFCSLLQVTDFGPDLSSTPPLQHRRPMESLEVWLRVCGVPTPHSPVFCLTKLSLVLTDWQDSARGKKSSQIHVFHSHLYSVQFWPGKSGLEMLFCKYFHQNSGWLDWLDPTASY